MAVNATYHHESSRQASKLFLNRTDQERPTERTEKTERSSMYAKKKGTRRSRDSLAFGSLRFSVPSIHDER